MWRRRIGWAALVAASLLLYLFENNAGTRIVLLCAVCLPLVASLPLLFWSCLVCSWDKPEEAARSQTLSCSLTIQAPRLCAPLFFARLEIVNLLTGECRTLPLRCILRAGRAVLPLTLAAAHSGVLELSLRDARLHDAFGVFSRRIVPPEPVRVTVRPARLPVQISADDFWRDSDRYSTQRAGTDPSETFRVRDYAPGDPVRQIHWKLSEKLDRTLVRDFGLPLGERVLLTLTPCPATPDEVDEALDLLFSIGHALCTLALPCTVRTPADVLTLHDADDWAAFSERLLSARLVPVQLHIEGLQVQF